MNKTTSSSNSSAPHVVEVCYDSKTGEIVLRQYTLKESAIHMIKGQPFFGKEKSDE